MLTTLPCWRHAAATLAQPTFPLAATATLQTTVVAGGAVSNFLTIVASASGWHRRLR